MLYLNAWSKTKVFLVLIVICGPIVVALANYANVAMTASFEWFLAILTVPTLFMIWTSLCLAKKVEGLVASILVFIVTASTQLTLLFVTTFIVLSINTHPAPAPIYEKNTSELKSTLVQKLNQEHKINIPADAEVTHVSSQKEEGGAVIRFSRDLILRTAGGTVEEIGLRGSDFTRFRASDSIGAEGIELNAHDIRSAYELCNRKPVQLDESDTKRIICNPNGFPKSTLILERDLKHMDPSAHTWKLQIIHFPEARMIWISENYGNRVIP